MVDPILENTSDHPVLTLQQSIYIYYSVLSVLCAVEQDLQLN